MKFGFRKKEKVEKQKKSLLREWADSVLFAVIAATLLRFLLIEAYAIPTSSMESSLLVGDHLFVSKMHYGIRSPKTILQLPLSHQKIWGTEIPSYLEWIQLPQVRLPGFTSVKNNDPVVFNYPPEDQYPTDLKTFYVKRCIGIAGDTLQIIDKQPYINGKKLENPEQMQSSFFVTAEGTVRDRVFHQYGITDVYPANNGYFIHTTHEKAKKLAALNFIKGVTEINYETGNTSRMGLTRFPELPERHWTVDNYGPIYIPKKGDHIILNHENIAMYGRIITHYDHNENTEIRDGKLYMDGQPIHEYTFQQDYYFMMGDNRHNSEDSRFWGFVPADHIVGKPLFVWWSVSAQGDAFSLLDRIRWNRLFTSID